MSQEIVFTSARQGLRTGSTGFCTVRSTRGMPGNLAQLLERLTGYPHAFDPYGDQSHLNPVNFAHYIARPGEQKFHILARISNAPLDHTNRSNKLAHLLAVVSNELETQLSEGPAAESLKIPWVKDWSSDSAPCVLPDDKQIDLPIPDQPKHGACHRWKEATGNAGWAAVLAASASETSTVMQVILPRDVGSRPETWALELVDEALSLIPPVNRWDVTYSTFFGGNLPVSINCQWQCILDGTDAATRARLDPRAKTIDIPAIAAGKIPPPSNTLTTLTASTARPWDNDGEDSSIARRRAAEITRRSSRKASGADLAVDGEDAVKMGSPSTTRNPGTGPARDFSERRSVQERRPILLHPVSLAVFFLMIVAVVCILIQQWLRPEESASLQNIVDSSATGSSSAAAKREKKQQRERDEQRDNDESQRRKLEEEDAEQALLNSPKTSPEITLSPDMAAADEPIPDTEVQPLTPALPPLQHVRDLGNRLPLKLPSLRLDSAPDGRMSLARIHVNSVKHFQLVRIIGGRSVLKPGWDYSVELKDNKSESFREWDVIRKSISGTGLGDKPHVVGTFRLDQKFELSFRWDRRNDRFEFINCLVEMEAGEPDTKLEQERARLREVNRIKPIRFDLNESKRIERLVNRNELTNTQALEFRSNFVNLPGDVTRKGSPILRVGDTVKFDIQGAKNGNYPRAAEISVKLVEAEQAFQIEMEIKVGMLRPGENGSDITLVPFTPVLMKSADKNIAEEFIDIERERTKLQKLVRERENLEKEAEFNDSGKIKDPEVRKRVEALQTHIENMNKQLAEREAELVQRQQLAKDLRKLLADIAAMGQLEFSLRLMIPDAGENGIELIMTDNGLSP